MSGTRRYRKLSAETLDTLLRLISEDELTPKQIAERAGVSRQQVYEYRKKLKDREQAAPLNRHVHACDSSASRLPPGHAHREPG